MNLHRLCSFLRRRISVTVPISRRQSLQLSGVRFSCSCLSPLANQADGNPHESAWMCKVVPAFLTFVFLKCRVAFFGDRFQPKVSLKWSEYGGPEGPKNTRAHEDVGTQTCESNFRRFVTLVQKASSDQSKHSWSLSTVKIRTEPTADGGHRSDTRVSSGQKHTPPSCRWFLPFRRAANSFICTDVCTNVPQQATHRRRFAL